MCPIVHLQVLQDELNRKILDSLLKFIRKCTSTFQHKSDDWASRMRASEIPTAALSLGMMPKHDVQEFFEIWLRGTVDGILDEHPLCICFFSTARGERARS